MVNKMKKSKKNNKMDLIRAIWCDKHATDALDYILVGYNNSRTESIYHKKLVYITSLIRGGIINSEVVNKTRIVDKLRLIVDTNQYNIPFHEILNLNVDDKIFEDYTTYILRNICGYTIIYCISCSCYSNVFIVVDKDLNKYVLKCICRLNDFENEKKCLEILNSNIETEAGNYSKNIVKMITSFSDDESHYILLELLNDFVTLTNYRYECDILTDLVSDDLMNDHDFEYEEDEEKQKINIANETEMCNRNKERNCTTIFNTIAKIILYIHSLGIVHRDIKPDNIMYNPKTGEIKMIDFAYSNIKYDIYKSVVGTRYYIDPLLRINNVDYSFERLKKADLWSFGETVFFCINHKNTLDFFEEEIFNATVGERNIYAEMLSLVEEQKTRKEKRLFIQKLHINHYDYNRFNFIGSKSKESIAFSFYKDGIIFSLRNLLNRDPEKRFI